MNRQYVQSEVEKAESILVELFETNPALTKIEAEKLELILVELNVLCLAISIHNDN